MLFEMSLSYYLQWQSQLRSKGIVMTLFNNQIKHLSCVFVIQFKNSPNFTQNLSKFERVNLLVFSPPGTIDFRSVSCIFQAKFGINTLLLLDKDILNEAIVIKVL